MQRLRHLLSRLSNIPGAYWKFSAVEFAFWFAWAAGGYLSLFLKNRGYSAGEVGLFGALSVSAGIVAAPFWGMMADRLKSVRRVLLIVMVTSAAFWALVPLSSGIFLGSWPILFLVIPVGAFFRMPISPLLDSWVVRNAGGYRLKYSALRLWGSIGYAVMSLALSAVLPRIGVESTFYMFAVALLPALFLCFFLKDDAASAKRVSFKELQVGRLLKNYYLMTYFVFAFAVQMCINTIFTFLPFLLGETGVSSDSFGFLMGFQALFEIPAMLYIAKSGKRPGLPLLLLCAAGLYILETFSYSFINGFFWVMAVSALHGLAGGLYLGTGASYVYSLAPEELKATAQTLMGSVNALAGIIGSTLGGYLIDLIGVRSYYALVGTMIFFAALFFIGSLWLGKRVSRAKSPLEAAL